MDNISILFGFPFVFLIIVYFLFIGYLSIKETIAEDDSEKNEIEENAEYITVKREQLEEILKRNSELENLIMVAFKKVRTEKNDLKGLLDLTKTDNHFEEKSNNIEKSNEVKKHSNNLKSQFTINSN